MTETPPTTTKPPTDFEGKDVSPSQARTVEQLSDERASRFSATTGCQTVVSTPVRYHTARRSMENGRIRSFHHASTVRRIATFRASFASISSL
jgi:hypothetical protein